MAPANVTALSTEDAGSQTKDRKEENGKNKGENMGVDDEYEVEKGGKDMETLSY